MNQPTSFVSEDDQSLLSDPMPTRLLRLFNNPVTGVRLAGVGLLVLAMTGYLLQGLHGPWPGYYRWAILGFVTVLFICGLLCSSVLKEKSGARIFLVLAAATIPVQITQSSAWLLERISPDLPGLFLSLPAWWQPGHGALSTIIFSLALSVGMCVVVGQFVFAILARRHSLGMSRLFLGLNLLLLLPWRTGMAAGLILMAAMGLLGWHEYRHWRYAPLLHTLEGWSARVLLTLPVMLLVARILVYAQTDLFYAFVLLLFAAPFIMTARVAEQPWLRLVAEISGLILLVASLGHLGWGIREWLGVDWPILWLVGLGLFCFPCLTGLRHRQDLYHRIGILIVESNLILATLVQADPHLALFTGIVSLPMSVAAGQIGQRSAWFMGVMGTGFGFFWYGKLMLANYQLSPWLNAGILGILILLAGSIWEKQRRTT